MDVRINEVIHWKSSVRKALKMLLLGQPGWLSGLVPPSAQGVILETWDRIPHQAPCMEPASPPLPLSLCVCVSRE